MVQCIACQSSYTHLPCLDHRLSCKYRAVSLIGRHNDNATCTPHDSASSLLCDTGDCDLPTTLGSATEAE